MGNVCAFGDCGDPACHLCKLAKIPITKPQGKAADGIRESAKSVPRKVKSK